MNSLQNALADFDVQLVVSSSWRETNNFHELEDFLRPIGKELVGVTPVIDDPFLKAVRHHEIQKYLKDNGCMNCKYCAIDDTTGFFEADTDYVYFTDTYTGFTESDVQKLKDMLSRL